MRKSPMEQLQLLPYTFLVKIKRHWNIFKRVPAKEVYCDNISQVEKIIEPIPYGYWTVVSTDDEEQKTVSDLYSKNIPY